MHTIHHNAESPSRRMATPPDDGQTDERVGEAEAAAGLTLPSLRRAVDLRSHHSVARVILWHDFGIFF